MRLTPVALAFIVIGSAAAAQAQLDAPRLNLSAGFQYTGANAPPAGCQCFGIAGGYLSADAHIKGPLFATAQFAGGHANNISSLGQNLTLTTYLFGAKATFLRRSRFTPYGEFLLGGAHGSDSYFPTGTTSTTAASSFAYSPGGGLDIALSPRYALRLPDVEYLHTAFPNGSSNFQNQIRVSAGLVVDFGRQPRLRAAAPPPPAPPSEIVFSCGADSLSVDAGRKLTVTGHAETLPDQLAVTYAWWTDGGTIHDAEPDAEPGSEPGKPTSRQIVLDTTGMPAGTYVITGRAALVSAPSVTATCRARFQVDTVESPTAPTPVAATAPAQITGPAAMVAEEHAEEKVFHLNVRDALFDYDKADIRPDAALAIADAATWLRANPQIQVLVGGYSDERGSLAYNLTLGEKRAAAARNALIDAGIAPARLTIVSYGKTEQVCTKKDENCYQQNRRAAFNLHLPNQPANNQADNQTPTLQP